MKRPILRALRYSSIAISLLITTSCTYNTTAKGGKEDTTKTAEVVASDPSKEAIPNTTKSLTPAEIASDTWLLVPGKSAGMTPINEDAEKVYNSFGRPDGGDAAMQKAVAIWYTNHDSTKHSTAIYTQREPGEDPVARVKQIRITSPSFQTMEGIHTGSTLKEIEAAYPVQKGETYPDAGTQYRVYDSKQGIAFEVRPYGMCVAIVIHEANTLNGGTTYLKFRTTNKYFNPA